MNYIHDEQYREGVAYAKEDGDKDFLKDIEDMVEGRFIDAKTVEDVLADIKRKASTIAECCRKIEKNCPASIHTLRAISNMAAMLEVACKRKLTVGERSK